MGETTSHLKRIRSWRATGVLLLAVPLLLFVSSAHAATARWSLEPSSYNFGTRMPEARSVSTGGVYAHQHR
jgi:hypothetical protein